MLDKERRFLLGPIVVRSLFAIIFSHFAAIEDAALTR